MIILLKNHILYFIMIFVYANTNIGRGYSRKSMIYILYIERDLPHNFQG